MFGWLMTASGSLEAHHSLAGVTSIKFSNPHGSLALAVKNAASSTTEWVMTLGSATALAQWGIGKTGPNAPRRGQHHGEVPPRKGRESVGISQDRDHAGRACDPDLRR